MTNKYKLLDYYSGQIIDDELKLKILIAETEAKWAAEAKLEKRRVENDYHAR
jgi:hypothetical protein